MDILGRKKYQLERNRNGGEGISVPAVLPFTSLVAGRRGCDYRGCCRLSFSPSMGKSVQDRADNSVAAGNTKDE
jgi:hypothetical protein